MSKLTNKPRKRTWLRNSLIFVLPPLLIPLFILAIVVVNYAATRKPTKSSIDSVSGIMRYHQPGSNPTTVNNNNKGNFRLHGGISRRLVISQGRAGLGFLDNNGRIGATNLFLAFSRFSNQPTRYYYPCGGQGSFTIGWKPGEQQASGGGCEAVTLRGRGSVGATNPRNHNIATAPGKANKTLLKAQASSNNINYCSAVADSGKGWGAAVSNSPWDIFSSNEPCATAIQRCELNSGGSCSVTNTGELTGIEPDDRFTAALKCGIQDFRHKDELKGLDNWVLSTSQDNELKLSDCTLHILDVNDFLVYPVVEPTVITTDIASNGKPTIVVLAGAVNVVPATENLTTSRLVARQRCFPNSNQQIGLEQAKPVLVAQAQGIPQIAQSPIPSESEACLVRDLSKPEREDIYNSNNIQPFFLVKTTANELDKTWSPELQTAINEYQTAVQAQFVNPQ